MFKKLSNDVRIAQIRRYHIEHGPTIMYAISAHAERQPNESVDLRFDLVSEEEINTPYPIRYVLTLDRIIDIQDEDASGYGKVVALVRCKNGKTRKLSFIYNFIFQNGELVGIDGEEFDFLVECGRRMLS